jgi:AcrR family transcriptional regulator
MDDVAKVLNVTKPALYYYIKTKQEILYECHAYALDLAERARQIAWAETEDPLERLRLLLFNYIELLTSTFGSYAVLAEPVSSLDPEHREKILVRMRDFDAMCRRLLNQAMANGSIPPCNPRLAIAFFMGSINYITRWYSPEGQSSGKEIADAFCGFIIDGLRGNQLPMQDAPALPVSRGREPELSDMIDGKAKPSRRSSRRRATEESSVE